MSDLFDKTTNGLATSINMRQLRHNVISSNIANAETPNYHAKKLDFEDSLRRAMDTDGMRGVSMTHPDHVPVGPGGTKSLKADIYENSEGAINNDGNTVDLEKEMSSLSENTLLYKAAMELVNKKIAALRYAASDGGGNR